MYVHTHKRAPKTYEHTYMHTVTHMQTKKGQKNQIFMEQDISRKANPAPNYFQTDTVGLPTLGLQEVHRDRTSMPRAAVKSMGVCVMGTKFPSEDKKVLEMDTDEVVQ